MQEALTAELAAGQLRSLLSLSERLWRAERMRDVLEALLAEVGQRFEAACYVEVEVSALGLPTSLLWAGFDEGLAAEVAASQTWPDQELLQALFSEAAPFIVTELHHDAAAEPARLAELEGASLVLLPFAAGHDWRAAFGLLRHRGGEALAMSDDELAFLREATRQAGFAATRIRQLQAQRVSLEGDKMEAVGRLARRVAHDVNNVLGAITGSAAVVARALEADDRSRRYLGHIENAAARAARLTRQLLTVARSDPGMPESLELDATIARSVGVLKRLLGASQVLETDLDSGGWCVYFDPGKLEEALVHFTANARDAMPESGRLMIRTRRVNSATLEGIAGVAGRELLELSVSDDGRGMSEDVRARAFEPFFSTKPVGEGTGLGLATVHGSVLHAGGAVRVVSSPGGGTTVTMVLPRCERQGGANQPLASVVPAAGDPSTMPPASATVLLVEDVPELMEVTAESLRALGYRVLTAPDGEQALNVARHHVGSIDVLIVDVVLPGMRGTELVRRVKGEQPNVDVLFTSGLVDDEVIAEAGVSAAQFLSKPYTFHALGERVRALLAAD